MPVLIGDPGLVIVEYLDIIVCHRPGILVLLLGLLGLAAPELIVDIHLKDTDGTHVILLSSRAKDRIRTCESFRLPVYKTGPFDHSGTLALILLERVDGLEPTTGGLESRSSTTELHPQFVIVSAGG